MKTQDKPDESKQEQPKPEPTPEPKQESKPAAKTASNGLPEVDEVASGLPVVESSEPDIKEYKGRYKNSKDGLVYALAVKEDAANGRTHFLRNTRYFDNCTKEEFKERYEKE